jgi:hypothetical protein
MGQVIYLWVKISLSPSEVFNKFCPGAGGGVVLVQRLDKHLEIFLKYWLGWLEGRAGWCHRVVPA